MKRLQLFNAAAALASVLVAGTCLATPSEYQPDFNRGYNAGYLLGYDSGFTSGLLLGETDGADQGQEEGYQAGWDGAYTLAYDRAYGQSFGLGSDKGYVEGVHSGFEKGQSWAHSTWTAMLASSIQGSILRVGDMSGLILTSGITISWNGTGIDGSSAGTLSVGLVGSADLAGHYHDLGFDAGETAGYTKGSSAGYDEAFPAAHAAAYALAYPIGAEAVHSRGKRSAPRLDTAKDGILDSAKVRPRASTSASIITSTANRCSRCFPRRPAPACRSRRRSPCSGSPSARAVCGEPF